jgi:hypothetical protein
VEDQNGETELVGQLKRRLDSDAANDFVVSLIERQDFFGQSSARHKTRHAPNDAAGLVQHDHGGARGAQRFASFHSILSHAGQNLARGACAIHGRDGVFAHDLQSSYSLVSGFLRQVGKRRSFLFGSFKEHFPRSLNSVDCCRKTSIQRHLHNDFDYFLFGASDSQREQCVSIRFVFPLFLIFFRDTNAQSFFKYDFPVCPLQRNRI